MADKRISHGVRGVLDLGRGDMKLGEFVREAGIILAIDKSREMIAEARRKDSSALTHNIREDIACHEFPSSAMFISCRFTLQFMDLEDRKAILDKIRQALDWRGCAVIAEKVLDPDGKKQMVNHYLLNAYKRSMGLSDVEVMTKERAVRSALRPRTSAQNPQVFEDAGFEHAQAWLPAFGWELYLLQTF